MSDHIQIVCNLTDAEFRKREAAVLAEFKASAASREEIPDGYAFRAPGDRKWIALASELMILERECCPFFKFELTAEPNQGPATLKITGPAGTKEFVKRILC